MTDLTQLEAFARAATQKAPMDDVANVWVGERCFVAVVADVKCGRGDDFYGCKNATAKPRLRMTTAYREFIAAANPAAILALIERVRVAEANLVFLERDYADLKDGSYKQWEALAQLEIRYKSLLRSLTHAAAMSPPKQVFVEKDTTP